MGSAPWRSNSRTAATWFSLRTTVLIPFSTTTPTPSSPYTLRKPAVVWVGVQDSSWMSSTLVSATAQRDIHQSVSTLALWPKM